MFLFDGRWSFNADEPVAHESMWVMGHNLLARHFSPIVGARNNRQDIFDLDEGFQGNIGAVCTGALTRGNGLHLR